MKNVYVAENYLPIECERIIILLAKGFNDIEFFYPYYRFCEAGYHVTVAGLIKGDCVGKHGLKFPIETLVEEIDPKEYDLLYIPGGHAPELLKENEKVIEIVKHFDEDHKVIVSICHGPLVLAKAEIIEKRKITGWPEIQKELVEKGAEYRNETVVKDKNLITSRWPGDLPTLMFTVMSVLKEPIGDK